MANYLYTCLIVTMVASVIVKGHGDRGDLSMLDVASQPVVFNSPDELRSYLQELDKFFVIAGRPRFGRSGGNGAIFNRNFYPRSNSVPGTF